jgi:methylated-DNA-[protein]-cysteine S-methyltransferase
VKTFPSDSALGYAFFGTAIGRCAVGWTDVGIAYVGLPEATPAKTAAQAARQLPGAQERPPPPPVAAAVQAMTALLRGEPVDLTDVALDLAGVPEFNRRVYEATRQIPPGATSTYGEVAARVGAAGSGQAVGQALGHNPVPIVVPCHRVLAADGRMRGFSAEGGVETKRRMLLIEGAPAVAPTLF